MAKKRKSAPAASGTTGGRKYLTLAGVFALAFILAFALAWALFRRDEPPPPAAAPEAAKAAPPAPTLKREDTAAFLQAVRTGDFAAMRDRGEALFVEGARIPDSAGMFADYATSSFPPHVVYSFYSGAADGKVQRVLLTMDGEDKVGSFLAEEMNIVR